VAGEVTSICIPMLETVIAKPREELFYLYCILVYNNYKNLRSGKTPLLVNFTEEKIKKIMQEKNVAKYDLHSLVYKNHSEYIKTLLTTRNYEPTIKTDPKFYDTLIYLNQISTIKKLQKEWLKVKEIIEKENTRLTNICKEFAITIDKYLKFEPVTKSATVVRTFTPHNMAIYGKDTSYIILGVGQKNTELSLLHELVHLYVRSIDIKPSGNQEKLKNDVHDNLLRIYKRPINIMEESLVRALTTYISKQEKLVDNLTLSNDDRGLLLPKVYLEKLFLTKQKVFSKETLKNIMDRPTI